MRRRDIARKAVKTAIIVKAAQRLGQRAESTRGGTDHLARMLVVWAGQARCPVGPDHECAAVTATAPGPRGWCAIGSLCQLGAGSPAGW